MRLIITIVIILIGVSVFGFITYRQYQEELQLEAAQRRSENLMLIHILMLIGESVMIEYPPEDIVFMVDIDTSSLAHLVTWSPRNQSEEELLNLVAKEGIVITSERTSNSLINLSFLESQDYSRDDVIDILLDTSHDYHADIMAFLTNRNHPDWTVLTADLMNEFANEETFLYIKANFDHPDLTPDTTLTYLPMDVLEWLLQQVLEEQ